MDYLSFCDIRSLVAIKNQHFYQWLRNTEVSHRYVDVSLVNTYVPVTCVLSAFNTHLAHNRVFARVRRETAETSSLCALASLRPVLSSILSLLIIPYSRLALSRVPSPPQHSLFLVLYVHYTNNSSSVSTETSLLAPRPSHSLLLFFFFPLSLSSPSF